MNDKQLGVVVDGTFNGGLTVRLHPGTSIEGLRIGSFVVVEGQRNRYFSLIADMQLNVTDPRLLTNPLQDSSPFIVQALAGTSTYATVQVRPMLLLEKPDESDPRALPGDSLRRYALPEVSPLYHERLAESWRRLIRRPGG